STPVESPSPAPSPLLDVRSSRRGPRSRARAYNAAASIIARAFGSGRAFPFFRFSRALDEGEIAMNNARRISALSVTLSASTVLVSALGAMLTAPIAFADDPSVDTSLDLPIDAFTKAPVAPAQAPKLLHHIPIFKAPPPPA